MKIGKFLILLVLSLLLSGCYKEDAVNTMESGVNTEQRNENNNDNEKCYS